MSRHALPGLLLVLLLAAGLAACGPAGTVTPLPTGPLAEATQAPGPASSPTAASAATTAMTAAPATATSAPSPTPASLPGTVQSPAPAQPSAEPATATATAAPAVPDLGAIRLGFHEVVTGLSVPVGLAAAGDGSGRLFILEKVGRIRIVRDGRLADTPFLDITDRVGSSGSEQGLLGLAFHPDYRRNGLFFVYYTDRNGDTVVSRFSAAPGADQAAADGEHVLLQVDQPAANHNGGQLAFGPDGYLYIGLGDGGGAGDTFGNGQNRGSLLAKILRVEVGSGDAYSVPADNPFAGQKGVRPEVWAWGLRNPWRFSFDRATGDLYIADVGQGSYEEIDFQPAADRGGENYGWSIMEGRHCFRQASCTRSGLTLPVAEYDHGQGCSVTGGYVYRGEQSPAWTGVYFFGDYCSGRVWGLARDAGGAWQMAELAQTDQSLTSFGQDEAGELYTLDAGSGTLFQLVNKDVAGD